MADYKKVQINLQAIGEVIQMDDVTKEDSINPRSIISGTHVGVYTESIVGYLQDGKEFSKVWGQNPEVVEVDNFDAENPKYLLASGYHTITALLNVIDKAGIAHAKQDAGQELSEFEQALTSIDLNFDVTVHVKSKGKFSAVDAAKYHAAFSNVHGIQLADGEKSRAAYNALSQMNLTSAEGDDKLRPHINDRKLGAMLGVSKSTVYAQRQILISERFGVGTGKGTSEASSNGGTTETATEADPNEALNALENAASATATEATDSTDDGKASETENGSGDAPTIARQDNDGKDQKTDDRPTGSQGINVGKEKSNKSEKGSLLTEIVKERESLLKKNADDLSQALGTLEGVLDHSHGRLIKELTKNGDEDLIDGSDVLFHLFSNYVSIVSNTLEFNDILASISKSKPDAFSKSISKVSEKLEKGKTSVIDKLTKNNDGKKSPYIECMDAIFGSLINIVDAVATDNENR